MKKNILYGVCAVIMSFFSQSLYCDAYTHINNNSAKSVFFWVTKEGSCCGDCSDPYGGNPVECCASTKLTPGTKNHKLSHGDGGGRECYLEYPNTAVLHASTQDPHGTEKEYNYKYNYSKIPWAVSQITVNFPEDFAIPTEDLAWLQTPVTQLPITQYGAFMPKGLVNVSKFGFSFKNGQKIYAGSEKSPYVMEKLLWFHSVLDDKKVITLTGKYGNLNRTITITPTEEALTIKDEIAGVGEKPTVKEQTLDLRNIISDFVGQPKSGILQKRDYNVYSIGFYLTFTDTDVQIPSVQLYHKYPYFASGRYWDGIAYWIYPDKVKKGVEGVNWQPDTDPNHKKLNAYVHTK